MAKEKYVEQEFRVSLHDVLASKGKLTELQLANVLKLHVKESIDRLMKHNKMQGFLPVALVATDEDFKRAFGAIFEVGHLVVKELKVQPPRFGLLKHEFGIVCRKYE